MKKRIISIALIIAIISLFASCSTSTKNDATIFVATDTHYLSPSINDKGKAFTDMMDNADGKMEEYCDEIFDAFSSEVIASKPDVLILSGDLTFNGEKASHIDFVKKLKHIQDSGVPVLTIPGNHDINSKNTYEYKGDEYIKTDAINAEEYRELYFDFGMKNAQSVDEYSLSYLYKINNGLYALMLDTNAYGQNYVQDPSYKWIEEQLKTISDNNAQVITVSHQNLFAHNEGLSFGYKLYDADELLALYNKYEVKCNLSGHIHLQHIMENGVTEITTTSLLVSPVQYGIVKYNGDIKYDTKSVDVSKWAVDNNKSDENLLNFNDYAKNEYFNDSRNKALAQMSALSIPSEDKQEIADAFALLNSSYFAGTKCKTGQIKNGIELSKSQDGFISSYIESMLKEAKNDYNHCKIKR